jgi:hydrogenase expression/formation protein HypC
MCLALPARVAQLHEGQMATVELGGVRQKVSVALLEDLKVDDYVIIHVGYALTKLDPEEAHKTLAMLAEMGGAEQGERT